MFGRLLWKLLRSNRGRLAVALVAVSSGATVISALLNLQFDIERKLTQEFTALGPNIVVSAQSRREALRTNLNATTAAIAATPDLMDEGTVESGLHKAATGPSVASVAPYLYFVAHVHDTPIVVAGTATERALASEPTWRITGSLHSDQARGGEVECGVGRNVARMFNLAPNSRFKLDYEGQAASLIVAFVLDSGGPEDNQMLVDLREAQAITGLKEKIELVQVRVDGTSNTVWKVIARLRHFLPGYDVRPIRAVTQAEGNLLDRTRLLIVLMVTLILVLTALCVLATMAALAMERRKDVGLMKALGGSISRIVGLFLAEVGTLGAVGGLIGCVIGMVLARWMGERVFEASINPRWDIFPLTIALMIVVALAGALPLRFLGKVKPAVILRGE